MKPKEIIMFTNKSHISHFDTGKKQTFEKFYDLMCMMK